MRIAKEPKSSHWPFCSGGSWGDAFDDEGEEVEEGSGELDGREEAREASVGIETPSWMAVVIAEERRVLVGVALLSSEASKPGGGSIYLVAGSSSMVSLPDIFQSPVSLLVFPFFYSTQIQPSNNQHKCNFGVLTSFDSAIPVSLVVVAPNSQLSSFLLCPPVLTVLH